MRIKNKGDNVKSFPSNFKSNIKININTKIKKSELMKAIRDYCPADHIKAANNEYDLTKQHSRFNFPTIKCPSDNSSKLIMKYFNRKRYVNDSTNEFKRTAANHLLLKVKDTSRKILLNYPSYKSYEIIGKENSNIRYLCEILVSKHLAGNIATRRAAWVHNFFYNFHKLGDLSKSLIAKIKLLDNDKDKMEATLGIKCHQRGTEPYFPSVSFLSGMQYDYTDSTDKNKNNAHNENITVEKNKDNKTNNLTCKATKVDKNSKGEDTGNAKQKFGRSDTKLYLCTEDCIGATDEESKSFQTVLLTFGEANKKNIRTILDNSDACSNMTLDDVYLLPREKRNHPKNCYDGLCQSSFVLVRKLAIHYKNCRSFLKLLVNLNTAHQFIHDIDVATILGDIEYLIKLLALPTDKLPSVFTPSDFPPIENKNYANHIVKFKERCADLPDVVCNSCDMLVRKTEIAYPKENWKSVKTPHRNAAWKQFKDMLGIKVFQDNNIQICKYCQLHFNRNNIPPRSKLNNMDPGNVPKEIDDLTEIERMFITPVKVFQTVVKLGAVGKHTPHQNSRLSALKGNAIHIPLPLEQTLKQLEEETDFTKIPGQYIITHHIKDNQFLLRNLVDLDKVYDALCWLKEYNPFYKDINIPPRQSLFSDVSSDLQPTPTNTCNVPSSDENNSDLDLPTRKLHDTNLCHDPGKNISLQTNSSDRDVQIMAARTEGLSSKDGNNAMKSHNANGSNNSPKPINSNTEDTTAINEVERNTQNVTENLNEPIEESPTKMIEMINHLEAKGQIEHYCANDIDLKGKSLIDADNLYKFIKIDADPLSYKEQNIDLLSFPNIFPFGIAGENSPRHAKNALTPYMYEKTRLLSGRGHIRRNIPYMFYLLHRFERRAINQGVYLCMKNVKFLEGKNVEELKKMLQNDDKNIERNLNKATKKIPNSPSYWNAPRSMLKCMSETHGPATFFITFSPAEYQDTDLHNYLAKHNTDLSLEPRFLVTKDPVLTSTYIHQKFQSLHAFILESCCLGNVEHWFYRIEYQSRGTPHFHCMYWIKDAPIIGKSSDDIVMKFINEHITCEIPSETENSELYQLVDKHLRHTCLPYCKRKLKSRAGGIITACRFGFPRLITSKMILSDVIEAIIGRKSSAFKKRLYYLPRNKEEEMINDYNPMLLALWKGNMDIQFIGENSFSLEQYITKYITKADKSHLSNADFGLNDSVLSKIWQSVLRLLRMREVGAYEAWDRWSLNMLYECSENFVFVSTVFFKNRVRTMKSYTDLQEADSKSTNIFHNDMLSTFYPQRPSNLENMTLKDYAANYKRVSKKKGDDGDEDDNGDKDDERSEDHSTSCKNEPFIELNGNNGRMRKRAKEALVYHHEFDPHVDPEKYYFSLLLLFKPWRKEEDLKGICQTYQEAFEQSLKEFPQMKAYDNLKQKVANSRKKNR